jgi:hypothetical protein
MQRVIKYIFPITILVNLIIWYSTISLISSVIKSFGDCDKKYNVEKYIKSDWFCPIEDISTKEFFKNFDKPHHKGNR